MSFTVQFRNWTNNWSEFDKPETYPSFEQAKERADKFHSFTVEYIGNNCYNCNGCETWVEDETGQRIYEPILHDVPDWDSFEGTL